MPERPGGGATCAAARAAAGILSRAQGPVGRLAIAEGCVCPPHAVLALCAFAFLASVRVLRKRVRRAQGQEAGCSRGWGNWATWAS